MALKDLCRVQLVKKYKNELEKGKDTNEQKIMERDKHRNDEISNALVFAFERRAAQGSDDHRTSYSELDKAKESNSSRNENKPLVS
jgi:hypothetical protein